jgi:hypothetical protein
MNAFLHSLPTLARWPIKLLLASSMCLSLAWIAAWFLRRQSVALRANVWLVAYLSIAALVSARFAGWTIPLPILRTSIEPARVAAPRQPAVLIEHRRAPESRPPPAPLGVTKPPPTPPVRARHLDWRMGLGALWLLGAAAGLLRIAAGFWALQGCLRSAQPPARGSALQAALAKAAAQVEQLVRVITCATACCSTRRWDRP